MSPADQEERHEAHLVKDSELFVERLLFGRRLLVLLPITFAAFHVSYGAGFLWGLVRKGDGGQTGLSR